MSPSIRWSMMCRAAVMAALLCASGCASFAKWQQERRDAALHRQQNREYVERNTQSKGDAAARAKQLQREAHLHQLQKELIARGDPDSLAAAALFEGLLSRMTSALSLELAARATAGAPNRADLAFVQLQLCESAPGCDAAPLEARQRALDPANGIAWTYQLVRADRANNGPDWRRAREGLAESTRLEVYWNPIVSRLASAAAGKGGYDSTSAAIQLLAIESALMPAFEPVSRACSVQDIQQPDVLAQCRRIAAAFRGADTAVLEAYGSSLAIRLWPEGSAESRDIELERRGLRYRVELMTRNTQKVNSPHAQQTLVALISRYPTEQAAYHALFVELGLKPDPPADWTEPVTGG